MPLTQYIYETHVIKNALLPFIFKKLTVRQSKMGLPNWHENIEIVCFIEGEGKIKLDTEWKTVKAGDIAIVNSETLHVITSESAVSYYFLIIDKEFCESNGIDIVTLKFREVIEDYRIFSDFEILAKETEALKKEEIALHTVPTIRRTVLGILINLCRDYLISKNENTKATESAAKRVKEIMLYLRSHLTDQIRLDEIANHICVSKYHMSREFKLFAGTTIFDYLGMLRCKEAKRMLSEGSTVTEAAITCGFENLSYFSKSFKKYMGILPSAYAKSKKI